MFELSLIELQQEAGRIFLPLFRITAFFMVAPIIGTRMVPQRVRMGLSLLLTMIVVPLLPATDFHLSLSLGTSLIVAQQVLIGVLFGFLLQVFFHVFVMVGQMIAMQMGLGFASMIDPSNGVSVAVVSQLFVILTTLLFLAMNGHLLMIEIMIDSFKQVPIGANFNFDNSLWQVANYASWMFANALLLALPAVTALLIVNLTFGVMTRAAPQLNIFSLGFPTSLVLGGIFLWLTLAGFLPNFSALQDATFLNMQQLFTL